MMAEMKRNGIVPDNFSYNICINAYGTRADFFGLENTLKEMECAPEFVVDWDTYAVVVDSFIGHQYNRKKKKGSATSSC